MSPQLLTISCASYFNEVSVTTKRGRVIIHRDAATRAGTGTGTHTEATTTTPPTEADTDTDTETESDETIAPTSADVSRIQRQDAHLESHDEHDAHAPSLGDKPRYDRSRARATTAPSHALDVVSTLAPFPTLPSSGNWCIALPSITRGIDSSRLPLYCTRDAHFTCTDGTHLHNGGIEMRRHDMKPARDTCVPRVSAMHSCLLPSLPLPGSSSPSLQSQYSSLICV